MFSHYIIVFLNTLYKQLKGIERSDCSSDYPLKLPVGFHEDPIIACLLDVSLIITNLNNNITVIVSLLGSFRSWLQAYLSFAVQYECVASDIIDTLSYSASIVSPTEETSYNCEQNIDFLIASHDTVQIRKTIFL